MPRTVRPRWCCPGAWRRPGTPSRRGSAAPRRSPPGSGKSSAGEPAAQVDYIETVGWPDLAGLDIIDRDALVALAVKIGRTRLIDNTILTMKE